MKAIATTPTIIRWSFPCVSKRRGFGAPREASEASLGYVLGTCCRDQCKTTRPARPIIPSLFSSAKRSRTPLSCG